MAKKEIEKKNVDVKFEGLGTFQESTGGGTPIPKGETLAEHPEAHRVQQPRDENGQFTYNAANRKNLKYGPSRGKTIPPYLRIKNGQIGEKDDSRIVRKDNIYNVSVKLSGYTVQDLIQDCREYIGKEGASLKGNDSTGFKYKTDLGDVTYTKKVGKKSATEKAAIMSKYKDDIKNLTFTGDKNILQQDWDKYREGKGIATNWGGSLLPKQARTIKPKKPKATNNNFTADDMNLIKTNPRAFQAKYSKEFGEIASIAQQAGMRVNVNNLLKVLSSGNISSFDEFKKLFKERLKVK